MLWNPLEVLGWPRTWAVRILIKFFRILWNPLESFRILWNPLESFGQPSIWAITILWNLLVSPVLGQLESFEFLWVTLQILDYLWHLSSGEYLEPCLHSKLHDMIVLLLCYISTTKLFKYPVITFFTTKSLDEKNGNGMQRWIIDLNNTCCFCFL